MKAPLITLLSFAFLLGTTSLKAQSREVETFASFGISDGFVIGIGSSRRCDDRDWEDRWERECDDERWERERDWEERRWEREREHEVRRWERNRDWEGDRWERERDWDDDRWERDWDEEEFPRRNRRHPQRRLEEVFSFPACQIQGESFYEWEDDEEVVGIDLWQTHPGCAQEMFEATLFRYQAELGPPNEQDTEWECGEQQRTAVWFLPGQELVLEYFDGIEDRGLEVRRIYRDHCDW